MPSLSQEDFGEMLGEESKKRQGQFNKNNALYKLYNDYVKKYRTLIEKALVGDETTMTSQDSSVNKHLNYRLQQVIYLMDAIEV